MANSPLTQMVSVDSDGRDGWVGDDGDEGAECGARSGAGSRGETGVGKNGVFCRAIRSWRSW
ncbi:hypothetical protein GCM10023217_22360 [Gordonia alkaliphila]|uniref:Uncharacterized protein n=1 Tax=Gordonia alkaliphila TaxID=1053547 RepID=A0ABP8ZAN0_9ACTN